jgi:hypothetical protein
VDTKIIDDANNVHIYLGLGLFVVEGIIVVGRFESAPSIFEWSDYLALAIPPLFLPTVEVRHPS